jgi:hypothetical protein
MVLPKVMSKVFLASLPNELGKYVLDSGEAIHVSGEFRMHGPEVGRSGAGRGCWPRGGGGRRAGLAMLAARLVS